MGADNFYWKLCSIDRSEPEPVKLYRIAFLHLGQDHRWGTLEQALNHIELTYYHNPHTTAELFRDGRPILGFNDGEWHALGDDYLDPVDYGQETDMSKGSEFYVPEAGEGGCEPAGPPTERMISTTRDTLPYWD